MDPMPSPVKKRQKSVGGVPITADGREKRMAQRCKDGATGKVGMSPEPALHCKNIAFTRGGPPADTALLSTSTSGGHTAAAAPRAVLRNANIAKGEKDE